jgi:hypothetical protein
MQAAKRQEVAEIVAALEAHNPTENPTQHLDLVEGTWNLLYTTITITVRWTGHSACMTECCVTIGSTAGRLCIMWLF